VQALKTKTPDELVQERVAKFAGMGKVVDLSEH
jgi:hypothetical protein